MSCDDDGWAFDVTRDDGEILNIWIRLVDSGDADDGVYGVHGNVILDIVEHGGRIVGGFAPYNYSDRVWADYDDDREWEHRLEIMNDCIWETKSIVDGWLSRKD